MLSDFELNIYKALDELVGSEKKFKILETEDILNTTKKFDTTADIAKIPDVIKDFKDKDLIDLKYFTPEEFCLMIKKDLNELIAETNVSFLGSFFGAIVCGIVFVLLYFFLKR